MKKMYRVSLRVLSVAIGAFFIISAYLKTIPVQYFEYTISSQLPVSDTIAGWAARFFIGLEAALGLLLVVNVFGKRKWVLWACLVMLAAFSIHLAILWVRLGNEVNCGCMGSLAPMSPGASLLKNVLLALLLIILLHYLPDRRNRSQQLLAIIIPALVMVIPFFLFPLGAKVTLPYSRLYSPEQPGKPLRELRTGKHIVSFMSLTCKHCRHAAAKIQEIHNHNPEIPFYIFFPYEEADSMLQLKLTDFLLETQLSDIPYSFILQKSFTDMVKAAGGDGVPTMLWMEDSTIIRKIEIPDLNQKEMELWLKF